MKIARGIVIKEKVNLNNEKAREGFLCYQLCLRYALWNTSGMPLTRRHDFGTGLNLTERDILGSNPP